MIFGVVTDDPAPEIGLRRSYRDRIGRDLAAAQFLGQIASEHFDATLRHCVGRVVPKREPRETTRNVHDAAPVLEQRNEFLGDEEEAAILRIDELVELLLGRLQDGLGNTKPGVVDEIIKVFPGPSLLQGLAETLFENLEGVALAR